MKAKKKPLGIKHRLREDNKRKERIALAVAISIAIILISSSLINSMLNQPSTRQPASSTSKPKAAIVDQLSLTYPNQTFIKTATNTLKQVGYSVDYYPGEEVTVEFYRNLPTHNYAIILLRVHSAAAAFEEGEFTEAPVSFFTSENYSRWSYVWEQLTDQLVIASYSMPRPPYYFGITPKFVTSSMNGKFQDSIIIMMGCESLNSTGMAEAFIEKGAKVYIGWNKSVVASRTDEATLHLLQHFLTEKQTMKQAIAETNMKVEPDPSYNSLITYYPLEAGQFTIENQANTLIMSGVEIHQHSIPREKTMTKTEIHMCKCSLEKSRHPGI